MTIIEILSEKIDRQYRSIKCKHLGKIYEASITKIVGQSVQIFIWSLDLYVEVPLSRYLNSSGLIVI